MGRSAPAAPKWPRRQDLDAVDLTGRDFLAAPILNQLLDKRHPRSATSGRLATETGEPAPGSGWVNPRGWVGLFGLDEFDCAEPFEWPVHEEHLERQVGLDVGL
jgi:hypothetical protein